MKPLTIFKLGITPYDEALSFQFELVERVRENKGKNSFLMLLEHAPVITLGKNANAGNVLVTPELLKKKNIELKQTNRGGDVTYHGPGQLVGYPILSLAYHKKSMREYVHDIERTIINALARYGITGFTKDDKTAGVWTHPDKNNQAVAAKIGFIGMRVSKGITCHGFSLNISNDLDSFNLINPCGMKKPQLTSVSELLGKQISVTDFMKDYIEAFKELFNTEIIEIKTVLTYIPKEIP